MLPRRPCVSSPPLHVLLFFFYFTLLLSSWTNAFLIRPPVVPLARRPHSSSSSSSSLSGSLASSLWSTPSSTFLQTLEQSLLVDGDESSPMTFVRLTLSTTHNFKNKNEADPSSISKLQCRLIETSTSSTPVLNVVYTHPTNTITKNYPLTQAKSLLEEHLASPSFKAARLFTTTQDWILEAGGGGDQSKPMKFYKNKPTYTELEVGAHDRTKKRRLALVAMDGGGGDGQEDGEDKSSSSSSISSMSFLQEYEILGADGRPKAGMKDKFRQIEKFVEILESLVEKSGLESAAATASEKTISLLDAGCGKGYLTFAMYEFLTRRGYQVQARGVDVRKDVVDKANAVAKRLGYSPGLNFVQGSIADVTAGRGVHGDSSYDIVVALHACDTATDDCLHLGVELGARVIVASPCCHKEVRREIKKAMVLQNEDKEKESASTYLFKPLQPILRHGILLERQAEIVTDSLRVLALQSKGYQSAVMEFIDDEATSKNLLITATKRVKPLLEQDAKQIDRQIQGLMAVYGLRSQRLLELLGAV